MRPFLKWPGNKYQIIDQIKTVLPAAKRLVEPFVGSGAVFLNTNYPNYLLGEVNSDLINLYKILQQEGNAFIDYASSYFKANNNNEERYYQLRTLYNETNDPRLKAALFIYFNKHGYNGLCRYNQQGQFNVPYGRYEKPSFPRASMEHFYAKAKKVKFSNKDFLVTMRKAKPGDVVYCDPPYVPLSNTANFTNYSPQPFTEKHQLALAEQARQLATASIPVIISNHDIPFTRRIYHGAKISSFKVQRNISCNGAKRVKVTELLAVFN